MLFNFNRIARLPVTALKWVISNNRLLYVLDICIVTAAVGTVTAAVGTILLGAVLSLIQDDRERETGLSTPSMHAVNTSLNGGKTLAVETLTVAPQERLGTGKKQGSAEGQGQGKASGDLHWKGWGCLPSQAEPLSTFREK